MNRGRLPFLETVAQRRHGRLLQRNLQLFDVIAVGQGGGRLVRQNADGTRPSDERMHSARTVRRTGHDPAAQLIHFEPATRAQQTRVRLTRMLLW